MSNMNKDERGVDFVATVCSVVVATCVTSSMPTEISENSLPPTHAPETNDQHTLDFAPKQSLEMLEMRTETKTEWDRSFKFDVMSAPLCILTAWIS